MRIKRRASMLVELVLLMSAGSAVLMAAVLLMHRSFELTSNFQSIRETQASLGRLSESFRRDVHRTVEVHHESDHSVRLVQSTGSSVVYEHTGNVIVRTERSMLENNTNAQNTNEQNASEQSADDKNADTQSAGTVMSYERYSVPAEAVVEWVSERMGASDATNVGTDNERMLWMRVKRPVAPQLAALRLELCVGAYQRSGGAVDSSADSSGDATTDVTAAAAALNRQSMILESLVQEPR